MGEGGMNNKTYIFQQGDLSTSCIALTFKSMDRGLHLLNGKFGARCKWEGEDWSYSSQRPYWHLAHQDGENIGNGNKFSSGQLTCDKTLQIQFHKANSLCAPQKLDMEFGTNFTRIGFVVMNFTPKYIIIDGPFH